VPTLSRDPYAPPDAPVADFVKVLVRTRPRPVEVALVLLWVGLFLDVVSWFTLLASGPHELVEPANPRLEFWLNFAINAARMLFVTWLYYKIAAGRNWARITFLILVLVTLPAFLARFNFFLIGLGIAPLPYGVVAVLWVVVPMLNVAALCLLFFPGRRWFRIEA
jgi:hypothetical protein